MNKNSQISNFFNTIRYGIGKSIKLVIIYKLI